MITTMSPARRLLSELLTRWPPPNPDGFNEAARKLLHARHLVAYQWALPYIAGRDVVEVGVNRGYGVRTIASDARSVVGVDLSFEMASQTHHGTGVKVVQANGQALPLADASVDTVVTYQVIEHVWNDVAYLHELNRVLRPGGLLLISTPQARRRLLFRQFPWNKEHLGEYDEVEWKTRLGECFELVDVLGLFGDDVADAVERRRIQPDPWRHFFSGPWGRPVRLFGRFVNRLLRQGTMFPKETIDQVLRTKNDHDLMRHFFFDESALDRALDLFAICRKLPSPPIENQQSHVSTFDGAVYWRARLGERPDLVGTGTNGTPLKWQRWLYKGKERAYLRLLTRGEVKIRGNNVLDFGCGTGHFEDVWERHDACRADGIDIVPAAIEQLMHRHPNRRYVCADLSQDASNLAVFGSPHLVTAIDVLYHIVDDEVLLRTLRALTSIIPPNGYFLFTDSLREVSGAPHVRFRSLNQWLQILTKLDLEYVDKEPVFAVNNHVVRGVQRVPGVIGALQHALDIPVLRFFPWAANNWAVLARR